MFNTNDLDTITIYVGSQDVTYDVLSGNTFTINNINEAISIAIYAQSTVSSDHNMTYSIGKGVSLSYMPDTIEDKSSYSAHLNLSSGYLIDKISISGSISGDVTSECFDWDKRDIYISSVEEDYYISISAYYK